MSLCNLPAGMQSSVSQLVCPDVVTAIQVTHSSFLYFMMQNFGQGAAPAVQVGLLLHNHNFQCIATYMGLAVRPLPPLQTFKMWALAAEGDAPLV